MVYVSQLVRTAATRWWPHEAAAYLWADTPEELEAFARRLGLRADWRHADRDAPHYDLTSGKRFQALRLGAREADRRDLARRRAHRRADRLAAVRAAAAAGRVR